MTSHPGTPPTCEVTYTAMRAAFVVTLDSLLRSSLDPTAAFEKSLGFFGCYPLLNSTSPQIQLECLLRTWQRCFQNRESADLLDECVIYAAYETLADVCCSPSSRTLNVAVNGPHVLTNQPQDQWLCSKTRCLQAAGQEDASRHVVPHLADLRDPNPWLKGSEDEIPKEGSDELLELVGRWRAAKSIVFGSSGLLTDDEQDILRAFFEEHPALIG